MSRTKAPRADKVNVVVELEEVFHKSSAAIFTEYRGMTVSDISALRNRIRPGGGQYHVVKNTLFKRAIGDKLTPELDKLLSGPTAVAFATEDAVDTTKMLLAFLKELRKPDVKVTGGLVDGKIYTIEQITALSKVPPRDVVLGQVVGTLQAPLSGFAGTMNNVLGEFARTLQALSDMRSAEGA